MGLGAAWKSGSGRKDLQSQQLGQFSLATQEKQAGARTWTGEGAAGEVGKRTEDSMHFGLLSARLQDSINWFPFVGLLWGLVCWLSARQPGSFERAVGALFAGS